MFWRLTVIGYLPARYAGLVAVRGEGLSHPLQARSIVPLRIDLHAPDDLLPRRAPAHSATVIHIGEAQARLVSACSTRT